MKKRHITAILAGALLFGYSTWALAQTASDTLSVSGTVVANCNLSAGASLDFGTSIDVLSGENVDDTATINVTCTNGTAYDIRLNEGTNGSSVTGRQMSHATEANTLDYQLFSDSGRTTNWGETDGTDTVADTGDGSEQSHTVFGRIPQGQTNVPPGAYSDTVTITVAF